MKLFGEDHKDLAELSTKEDSKNNLFPVVVCEGCGIIQVDCLGRCISSDCLENHGAAPSAGERK